MTERELSKASESIQHSPANRETVVEDSMPAGSGPFTGLAEIVVAKHRSGPTGIVSLQWKKESMCFTDHDGGIDHSIADKF